MNQPAKRKTLGIRRNLKEEHRRSQIKEAAIHLFSTKGYDQATMDDLVVEAGISKSLIYWYWTSKSALLGELIDTCLSQYVEFLKKMNESGEPAIKKMNRFFWEFAELFKKNDRLNKLVHFCSLHHSRKNDENFNEQVNSYYRKILELLEALFDQGVAEGIFQKDLDSKALALMALAAIEGYIYMSILEERMPPERALISLCIRYVMPGITLDVNETVNAEKNSTKAS